MPRKKRGSGFNKKKWMKGKYKTQTQHNTTEFDSEKRAKNRLTIQTNIDSEKRATSRLTIDIDIDDSERRALNRLTIASNLEHDEGERQREDRRLAFEMLQMNADEQRAFFGLRIVRGAFAQNSERLSGNNQQCIAIAMTSIAYHKSMVPVGCWEPADIDNILCYGDKLYTQSAQMLPRARRQQTPLYLNIFEVRKLFAFVEGNVAITVDDPEVGDYNGKIAGEQISDDDFVCLQGAITAFVERTTHDQQQQPARCPAGAVFTCNDISVGVFACYEQHNNDVNNGILKLYVFDSHCRDEDGRRGAVDGKACSVCFDDDIDALIEHLRHVVGVTDDDECTYNLSPIVLSVHSGMSRVRVLGLRLAIDDQTALRAPSTSRAQRCDNRTMNTTAKVTSQAEKRRRTSSTKTFLGETRTIVEEYVLSSLRNECNDCHALFYDQESSRQCCRKGKITLPLRLKADIPRLLLELFEGRHQFSKNFLEHIRAYNNSLAMASVGAKAIELQPGAGRSYPVMVIHGAVYHLMTDVNPADMQFGSIYYCDPNDVRCNEQRHESARTYDMKITLLHELEEMIRCYHPIAKLYMNMREKRQIEEARCAAEGGGQIPDVFIRFHLNTTVNRGTHNAPTNEHELGAVYVGNYDDVPAPGELCIYLRQQSGNRQGQITRLNTLSPYANPLCYPLLFPKGELGWNIDIPLVFADERQQRVAKRMRLTMREHAYYYIMVRPEHIAFNPLHYANMLNQQLMIDWFSRIDGDRTNFIRLNQPLLRADTYAGLIDHLAHMDDDDAAAASATANNIDNRVGRMTIMPSTFVGCRRYMESAYQDAMTITAKYGRPSLFITMTCNPNWPEIRAQLKSHQHAQDRPDIVARVFHCKMQQLLHEIRIGKVFRGYIAFVYTVEFQKRGLPHIHLLVYVDEAYRPREPHQVDKIVSAELPDPDIEPDLYERVVAFMIHGPCGEDNKDAGCNTKIPQPAFEATAENEARYSYKCSKGFPKPFADATEMDANGRVIMFRRRRDGRRISKTSGGKPTLLDNRHIAPYNPYLSLRFNAHINVDIVSNTKSVKYLFKYITKGQDQALITADDRTRISTGDEVTDYLDTRFLGSCEATWRLNGYELTGKSVSIVRLAVHLPGEKNIVFRDGQAATIAEQEHNNAGKPSTLEAFFTLNQQIQLGLLPADVTSRQGESSVARNLLYLQVPLFYTRYGSDGLWKRRVRASAVLARIHTISPRHREKFFLRMLLLYRPSPTSFEDLMTIDGIRHATFQEAAIAAGITRSDDTWRQTMEEVVEIRFPYTIRKVFCYLLANCELSNDRALWDQFLPDMMEDYIRHGATHEMAEKRVIRWTDRFLKTIGFQRGISVLNLQVDVDDRDADDEIINQSHHIDEIPIQVLDEMINIDELNVEQRRVYDRILASIDDDPTFQRAKCFYMQGCGGTGKTFVYNALLQTFHQRGVNTLAVAFTGIAAALLRGGRTAHNAFKLPVPLEADSTSWLRLGSEEAADLARVRLIVWDEVSMTSKYILNVVDRLLRDLHRRPKVPFGGICVVLGGDLRQVLPIATSRIASQELCFVNCNAWRDFEVYELLKNMRVRPEPDLPAGQLPFSKWLIHLGDGELQREFAHKQLHLPPNTIPLPNHILSNDLASDVFGDDVIACNDLGRWAAVVSDRAILCPRNDDCDRMNGMLLDVFPGELTEMLSVDTIESENHNDIAEIPTEHLNSLHPKGMPNHRIALKVGIPVMLVRNMSVTEGLMNGTRLIVKAIGRNVITCEILLGKFRGSPVVLPRFDFKSNESEFPFVLKRRQFPIKVCFAMTINKAQGQTLERVGIYLPRPVFAHGQLYVAFSRARRWADVKVCALDVDEQQGNLVKNSKTVYTQNVVNRPVLHAVQSRIRR